jgi:hypothetical protein
MSKQCACQIWERVKERNDRQMWGTKQYRKIDDDRRINFDDLRSGEIFKRYANLLIP